MKKIVRIAAFRPEIPAACGAHPKERSPKRFFSDDRNKKLSFELQRISDPGRKKPTDTERKAKNRPKKSDMTIYLIYLHNGQDRFGMDCEQIRRFAPISHCILRNRC